MRIFIVEDEELHLETVIMNIKKAGYQLAGYCMNADEAFAKIEKTKPDVVLVDIALPGVLNGITLAGKINRELKIPHIYTTLFTDNEIIKQAVATHPSGYITKPVGSADLQAAIEIAVSCELKTEVNSETPENKKKPHLILTKIGDRLVKIPVDEIKYIKADGDNYTSIFIDHRALNCRTTIKQMLQQLPDNFIQIHRSAVINIHFLDEINEQSQIAIINGNELGIGRKYKKNLLAAFGRI